jgi:hypothetical protein
MLDVEFSAQGLLTPAPPTVIEHFPGRPTIIFLHGDLSASVCRSMLRAMSRRGFRFQRKTIERGTTVRKTEQGHV